MNALKKLSNKNSEGKYICVGLDTDLKKIPLHLRDLKKPLFEFNRKIIESTAKFAAAYKLNFAFYENSGPGGFEQLKETIELIPKDILIIGDAKRGDIGNTASMYADSIFNYFGCDSTTINPYMGEDSVMPFLKYESKLNFILSLTSNPGSADFEKLKIENGGFLYQQIIKKTGEWNKSNNCGLVFGATHSEELKSNMALIGNLPVLLPGVGAQGGSLEDIVQTFSEAQRMNFLINVSRGIIYKSSGNDFAEAAAEELNTLNTKVKKEFNM